jgi:F-type H+-transporting ATPase subunit b
MAKKEQLVHNVVDVTHTADVAAVTSSSDWAALIQSPYTWITLSTLLFLGIFLRYVLPPINRALDARSHKIYEQLEQATLLRAQAQELLASYERERESNAKEAEAIIAAAKAEAEALRTRAETDLKQALERRSVQAVEKIARAEQEAVAFVRAQMLDIAGKAASQILQKELESSKEDPAITRAITAIEQQLH